MNVYDFDNTIYRGDSTFDFVLYCYRHYPKSMLNVPRTLWFGLLYALHLKPKLVFKENLYQMFRYIDHIEDLVDEFTYSHLDHIKGWYLQQQSPTDVVISASPEFLIQKFCKRIGIENAMASKVDPHTGHYDGLNCHGEEKVRRFYEVYPDGVIDEFYSDSKSDTPLAKISKKAYLVKGNERILWK